MWLHPLVLEASVLLCFWLCLSGWQRDAMTPGRRSFVLLTLLGMTWGIGELTVVSGWLGEWTADRLKYFASAALPPFWLGFAARTAPTGLANRWRWLPVALAAPPLGAYALLYSDRWSPLFLETIAAGDDSRGPLWPAFTAYGIALTLLGSALFAAAALRRERPEDWKWLLAMAGFGLVPLASLGAYLGWESRWPYDPTPVALSLALLVLRRGLLSGSLFQALSVSQLELVHQLPLGIAVTDPGGTVIELNPAAATLLRTPMALALGRSLAVLLDDADADLEIRIIPIDPTSPDAARLATLERAAKPPAPVA